MSHPSEVESPETYPSDLASTSSRWLSRALQHTLANAWQTADDFLQHFGPEAIMQALADADELRTRLLVKLANVHEKIAAKKSLTSATEDLRLALDEHVTTPEAVLELFPADDRIRHLKAQLLWRFMFEDAFYNTTSKEGDTAHQRAVGRLAFLVKCGLEESLLTLKDIIDGIEIERLADCLPPEVLRRIVAKSLHLGREKAPLDEERLLDLVPLNKIITYVPLAVIWQNVIVRRIAEPYGFIEAVPAQKPAAEPTAAAILNEAPLAAKRTPPQPPAKPTPATETKEEAASVTDVPPPSNPEGHSVDDEARKSAIDRLKEISRLPPSFEKLSTPILFSIESMYADLFEATSDEERAECIHESFPNESHLRAAMLALAELLEPSIDVTKPPISEADTEALVKLVVFEERRRKDGASSSNRSSVRPPPLPVGRAAGSIPAAARMSVPPPLPGSKGRD